MSFIRLQIGATYVYAFDRMGRKGELCKLLVHAPRKNSVAVEFEDGYQAVTSANALRVPKPGYKPQPKLFGGMNGDSQY